MMADDMSYILNSHIVSRRGEAPFTVERERIRVQLNGYLIVPKEMFTEEQIDKAFKAWFKLQRKAARRSAPARGLQKYRRKVQSTKGKKAYSRKRKR